MGYEKMTVRKIIEKISNNEVYLPALQRHFVWKHDRIEVLFDSIMKSYPIGTFLFWEVKKKVADTYTFYQFISDYHERDKYLNDKARTPEIKEEIIGVLDGQQRLSSLYIALQGSYAYKIPYMWANNNDAYPKRELYLNILHEVDLNNSEDQYVFKFLTEDEAKNNSNTCYWFKVKSVFLWSAATYSDKADDFIDDSDFFENFDKATKKIAKKNIKCLCKRMLEEEIINYYAIADNAKLDNILDIFVRVNSGGQQLSKSDLLFSTIVAHWDNAREEMENLLKQINTKGDGFKFNIDYLIRTCLVLLDKQVLFKVKSFEKTTIDELKRNWDKIKAAVVSAADVLVELGFSNENLSSYNSTIPIAYYLYNDGKLNDTDKQNIRKYLVVCMLNGVFGAHGDSVLGKIRNEFNERKDYSSFSFDWFKTIRIDGSAVFILDDDRIEEIFDSNQKNSNTYNVLMLLYPNLKLNQYRYDQDHIHPYSAFDKSKLKKLNIADDVISRWQNDRNKLPNLQLLEGGANKSKLDTPFVTWLDTQYSTDDEKNTYKKLNYIPTNCSYKLADFDEFYKQRKKLMITALKKKL